MRRLFVRTTRQRMQVTSCCACLSLRTGTIIIGLLQLIGPIIMLIMTFALNIKWQVSLIQVDSVSGKTIYAIYFCFVTFIAILLLVGVFKKNTVFMLPWLVLGMIGGVWGLVNITIESTILFVNHAATQGLAFLVGGLLGLVLYVYLWLVVYSYYQQMKSDKMNSGKRPRNYQEA